MCLLNTMPSARLCRAQSRFHYGQWWCPLKVLGLWYVQLCTYQIWNTVLYIDHTNRQTDRLRIICHQSFEPVASISRGLCKEHVNSSNDTHECGKKNWPLPCKCRTVKTMLNEKNNNTPHTQKNCNQINTNKLKII